MQFMRKWESVWKSQKNGIYCMEKWNIVYEKSGE